MDLVGTGLSGVASLGWIVCFILIVIKMFQKGQTVLGIVCILCCGIGGIIAFVYGWMKSGEWDIRNIMIVWTVCWVLLIIGGAMNPSNFTIITVPGR